MTGPKIFDICSFWNLVGLSMYSRILCESFLSSWKQSKSRAETKTNFANWCDWSRFVKMERSWYFGFQHSTLVVTSQNQSWVSTSLYLFEIVVREIFVDFCILKCSSILIFHNFFSECRVMFKKGLIKPNMISYRWNKLCWTLF